MELGETVVVADGDDESRGSLAAALHSAGYEVADTDRGDEALGLAQASNPAAVLLEIPLAGLCGYEICRALKAEPAFEAPIIFAVSGATISSRRVCSLSEPSGDSAHHRVRCEAGSVVELEAEGIGVLRNPVGAPPVGQAA